MLHWINKLHAKLIYINIYILYRDFLLTSLLTHHLIAEIINQY